MSEKLWHAKSFELRSSGSFSRSRGVKFLLRDPFTSLENLGFMPIAYYLPAWPKSSPYMCKAMETPVPDSQSNPIQGTHFLWHSSSVSLRLISKHPFSQRCRDCEVCSGVRPVSRWRLPVSGTQEVSSSRVSPLFSTRVPCGFCDTDVTDHLQKKSLTRPSTLQEADSSGWFGIFEEKKSYKREP